MKPLEGKTKLCVPGSVAKIGHIYPHLQCVFSSFERLFLFRICNLKFEKLWLIRFMQQVQNRSTFRKNHPPFRIPSSIVTRGMYQH